MNPFSLEGKLTVITGGGTGIGLAITKAVVAAGGRAVITGRREEPLKEACAALGSNVSYVVNDISDLPGIPALVDTIEREHGPIFGLVNNAGILGLCPTLDMTDDFFQNLLDTHLKGSFAMTRECLRPMTKRNEGSVIMMCSMASLVGLSNNIAYTAAKSALKGMVRSLMIDFSQYNIRFNDIAPGFIDTPMSQAANKKNPGRKEAVTARIPLGRYGTPEDIAHAAVYLLAPASQYVTGTEIIVDGGMRNAGL